MTSPRYDLDASIAVADRLLQHGGVANSHELAALLDYKSVDNGAFLSRVGAAKQFDLIEGQSNRLAATDLARAILEAPYPETAERARLEAFVHVPLFAAFLGQMEGKQLPPTKAGLQNLLKNEFGVPENRTAMAAARLLESAGQAGLFKVGGPTKMIRPTSFSQPEPADQSAGPPAQSPTPRAQASTAYPKLLEGALEQLPAAGDWSEEGLKGWLDLFELALRVVYKLPRNGGRGDRTVPS